MKQVSGKRRIFNLNLRSYEIECATLFAIFYLNLVINMEGNDENNLNKI